MSVPTHRTSQEQRRWRGGAGWCQQGSSERIVSLQVRRTIVAAASAGGGSCTGVRRCGSRQGLGLHPLHDRSDQFYRPGVTRQWLTLLLPELRVVVVLDGLRLQLRIPVGVRDPCLGFRSPLVGMVALAGGGDGNSLGPKAAGRVAPAFVLVLPAVGEFVGSIRPVPRP